VLVKTGHAEETVDVAHNAEIQRFEDTYKMIKKISKDAQKLLDVLKDLSVAQAELASDFYELSENNNELYNATLKYQDTARLIDQARVEFDESLKADLIEPISRYMGQYKDIQVRLSEENVRKVDMDRYARDARSASEKSKYGQASKTESKHDIAKANYDNLHLELGRDMPLLFNDRLRFFNPIFASYVINYSKFYANSSKFMSDPVPMVQHVNRSHIIDHPRVITSPEASYAKNKNADLSATHDPYTTHAAPAPTTYHADTGRSVDPIPPITTNPVSTGRAMPTVPTKPMLPSPRGVKAQAVFDFEAQESNELSFKNGDVINILKQNGEWWEGEMGGKKGLLPSNYVKLL